MNIISLFFLMSFGFAHASDIPKVVQSCVACHSLTDNEVKVGPPLFGVVGRKAASAPGFRYSPAMKRKNVLWTARNLDAYLAAPQTFVPGTRMAFDGISDAKERKAVIDYLIKVSAQSPAKG